MSAVPKLVAKGPHPVATIESITPEKAKEYLKTMVENRPIAQKRVIEYALAMDKGKWVLNNASLGFTAAGNLFDGQHRLEACILAGKSFITHVIRGIDDPSAFATVDVGKTRTHADLFALEGYTDQNNVASAATLLYYVKKGRLTQLPGPSAKTPERIKQMMKGSRYAAIGGASASIPKDELLEFMQPYRERLVSALHEVNTMKIDRVITRSMAVACLILFSEKDPVQALQFMRDLASGSELAATDPVHVLREKLLAFKAARNIRLSRYAVLLMMIKAWNARRSNEKWRLLKLVENEKFPKIK